MRLPETLRSKIKIREEAAALRQLPIGGSGIDFYSNDYIGFAKSETIFHQTNQFLTDHNYIANGATGSRLLSGNHALYEMAENYISKFHEAETALIFNSGYDANVGFFSSVPQKGDFILYDELCHASIRDGIQLSHAKSYKFEHNNCEALEKLMDRFNTESASVYIVTESVFSMDGDVPELEKLAALSEKHNCYLVVDEAHALGVFGDKGEGLIQSLQLQQKVFARIMTFGKGLGCHGAAVLGSADLRGYLINFSRSFIYTTALSPHAVATILIAYQHLATESNPIQLRNNINHFNQQKQLAGLKPIFVRSKSAIQSAIIPGNEKVKNIASQLQQSGFDVKPILSPTVPEGQERLRFCIHSYNSEAEISKLIAALANLVF
jgi:8-amino-7-oxononanoate synthase